VELITEELRKRFKDAGHQSASRRPEARLCFVRFRNSASQFTWYVVSYDGKDRLYGLLDGMFLDWRPFSLAWLQTYHVNGSQVEIVPDAGMPRPIGTFPELAGRLHQRGGE
jgi:hypothetical protein